MVPVNMLKSKSNSLQKKKTRVKILNSFLKLKVARSLKNLFQVFVPTVFSLILPLWFHSCSAGVQKGIESVLGNGVVAGFPVLGIKATLVDGAFHEVDSSVLAFEIAGRAATREGLRKCKSRLMEPIMKVS